MVKNETNVHKEKLKEYKTSCTRIIVCGHRGRYVDLPSDLGVAVGAEHDGDVYCTQAYYHIKLFDHSRPAA